MINISDYTFLGVLGCPQIGMNHLANLISASPYIAPKVVTDDYNTYLQNHYNNIKNPTNYIDRYDIIVNHIEAGFLHMGVEDHTQAEEWIKSNLLTTVLTDHTENAFWVMHKTKHLGKQAIVTIENYNSDMYISKQRNKLLARDKPWQYNFLYDKDVVCRLFDLNEDEVIAIDVAHFHSKEITSVIKSLNHHFGLDLDLDLCQDCHEKWRSQIFDD
jgi:hypothetical protein